MSKDTENHNKKLSFTLDGEYFEMEDRIFESGKSLSEIFTPTVASAEFSVFRKSLKNKEYDKVYSSETFEAISNLYNDNNIVYLKAGTKVLRARIINDLDDIYQEKNGIHFEKDVLIGYDWYNSKEPPIGISSEGRANSR